MFISKWSRNRRDIERKEKIQRDKVISIINNVIGKKDIDNKLK